MLRDGHIAATASNQLRNWVYEPGAAGSASMAVKSRRVDASMLRRRDSISPGENSHRMKLPALIFFCGDASERGFCSFLQIGTSSAHRDLRHECPLRSVFNARLIERRNERFVYGPRELGWPDNDPVKEIGESYF